MVGRIALAFVIVATISGTAAAQTSRLMGHVSYPDVAPLAKTAVLEITLEDISDATADGVVIATTRIARPGQTPVMFAVDYDAARVVPAGRYAVRAQIIDGATTLFESAKPVRVLTQGTGSVASIALAAVEAPKTAPAPTPAMTPKPTPTPSPKRPRRTELQNQRRRRRRNQRRRRNLRRRQNLTVADADANADAESDANADACAGAQAETNAGAETNAVAETDAVAEASVDARAKTDAVTGTDTGAETYARTEIHAGAHADAAPPSAVASNAAISHPSSSATAAHLGAQWTMTEVKNKPVRPADKTHRKIVLTFDADNSTFSGTTGCNDLTGFFQTADEKLTLRPDKSLQICRVDQRTERSVRSVINDTRGYRISGTTLELLDVKGQLIAEAGAVGEITTRHLNDRRAGQ